MPTTWPAKINKLSLGPQYKVQEFNTGAYAFKPDTTYYMWLYTTTPVGEKIRGWYASNKGEKMPKITVRIGTKQVVSDKLYKKPGEVQIYGHTGYYDPMKAMIPVDRSYPYIYARSDSKASNIWYKRTDVSEVTINGATYSVFDIYSSAERTRDSRRIQVVRCKQNLANDKVNPDKSFHQIYEPPKYAFEAYCHTDVPRLVIPAWEKQAGTQIKTGKATFDTITYNNLNLVGATTDINKYDEPEYTSADWAYIIAQNNSAVTIDSSSEFGPKMNGKTVYGIFQNNLEIDYYCGSAVKNNIKNSKINFYGIDGVKPISGIPEDKRSQSVTINYVVQGAVGYRLDKKHFRFDKVTQFNLDKNSSFAIELRRNSEILATYYGVKTRSSPDIEKENMIEGSFGTITREGNQLLLTLNNTIPSYMSSVNRLTIYGNEDIWKFKGWSIVENSYNSFAPFEQLVKENDNFNSKDKMTLYGIYSQGWTIKYKIATRKEAGIEYSKTNYTSATNYLYGKGQKTNNIPPEPLNPDNTENSLVVGWIKEGEELTAWRSWTEICQEEERPYSVIGITEEDVVDLAPRTRIIDEGTWKKVYKVYHDEEWEMPILTSQTFDYKITTTKNDEISQ